MQKFQSIGQHSMKRHLVQKTHKLNVRGQAQVQLILMSPLHLGEPVPHSFYSAHLNKADLSLNVMSNNFTLHAITIIGL